MAKELRTEIEIDAPADRVWRLLTEFDAYPDWNPFLRRASGEVKEGARLEVYMQPSGGRGMTFRPTVIRAEPNREFRWLGHLGVSGLFDGEHSFTIEPLEGNRVRFVQSERFTGVLVPLMMLMIEKDTKRGFEEMNQALKERAEAAQRST
ncbi:MAG: SRPBCC domain-containing protein [Chloroflexi bacterium]|nr:SRPBCC domain-containing protein [Chloroflexota bacterium]